MILLTLTSTNTKPGDEGHEVTVTTLADFCDVNVDYEEGIAIVNALAPGQTEVLDWYTVTRSTEATEDLADALVDLIGDGFTFEYETEADSVFGDNTPVFAVWFDGDVIGVEPTIGEALEAAIKTVRGWEAEK